MDDCTPWYETVSLPAMLRHARATYGTAMRKALDEAGFDDIPRNGLYVIGAMALDSYPLSDIIEDLGVTKQAAGQLVDALVLRGYLLRAVDDTDRRKLNVTLTDRGRAAASVQGEARNRIDAILLAAVGPDDLSRTRRTIAALCDIGRQEKSPAEAAIDSAALPA